MLTVKAYLGSTTYEMTQYVYATRIATGSDMNSNDMLSEVRHPDPTSGDPSSSYDDLFTVNVAGQNKTLQDRNNSVHTYSFDVVGRTIADAITTLGSGVNGSVRRREFSFDSASRPYQLTTYNAASGGSVVNQVQREYNGLGQLTKEYQEHGGAVNTGTSKKMTYTYSFTVSGTMNHSRPVTMQYPQGRVLTYVYGTAGSLDDTISRVASINYHLTTNLEVLTYLGLGTIVKRAHPQAGLDLNHIMLSGESVWDSGDQYRYDRFGRPQQFRWIDSGTTIDRYLYRYDANSNRMYRDNILNAAFDELYHPNGATGAYDALNQMQDFRRGTMTDTNGDGIQDTVASPNRSSIWDIDMQGNFPSVNVSGTSTSRTHDKQNRTTAVGAASLTWDNNGNMTKDETGRTFELDAWNHIIVAKDSGGTTLVTWEYDAVGRRVYGVIPAGTYFDYYFTDQWQLAEARTNNGYAQQWVYGVGYVDEYIVRDRDADNNGTLEQRVYVLQDAQYNVTGLTDTTGAVLERYSTTNGYGSIQILTPTWTNRTSSLYGWAIWHQGLLYYAFMNLYGNRNRDYSHTLQRFVQQDPVPATNLYVAYGNGPVSAVDPWGLQEEEPFVPSSSDPVGYGYGSRRQPPRTPDFDVNDFPNFPHDADGADKEEEGYEIRLYSARGHSVIRSANSSGGNHAHVAIVLIDACSPKPFKPRFVFYEGNGAASYGLGRAYNKIRIPPQIGTFDDKSSTLDLKEAKSALSFSAIGGKLEILRCFRCLMSVQFSHYPNNGGISSERQVTTETGQLQAQDSAASGAARLAGKFRADVHRQQHPL